MEAKKLYRSVDERVIGGVAGGLAEYFQTDPVLIRLLFFFFSFVGGGGLILYLVLWVVLPEDPVAGKNDAHSHQHHHPHEEAHSQSHPYPHDPETERKEKSHHYMHEHMSTRQYPRDPRRHATFGFIIIIVGLIFLADNLFPDFGVRKFWPIILIFIGLIIMSRQHDRH